MKTARSWRGWLTLAVVLLVACIPLFALGDSSSLALSGSSVTITSTSSGTLDFSINRAGDTTFDAFVQYRTVDGTAIAGTNYTPAGGSVLIPAGQSSATIPVTILGSSSLQEDRAFQLELLGSGGGSFTPSFDAQQTVNATPPGLPEAIASADLNGDGKPDLIIANGTSNSLTVLISGITPGTATASFEASQIFATGSDAVALATADLNGDGKVDLVVVNRSDDTIGVLFNTTTPGSITPSFSAETTFAVGQSPRSTAVADLNGDGKPDLVVANANDNTVGVLLNTTTAGASTPTFSPQQSFAAGAAPDSVTTADVNGDGLPDLIVANSGGNTVGVLLNTTTPGAATATFGSQQTFAVGTTPPSRRRISTAMASPILSWSTASTVRFPFC